MKSSTKEWIQLIALLVLSALIIFLLFGTRITVTKKPVIVNDADFCPANCQQNFSKVWLGVFDQQLYFVSSASALDGTKYYEKLCVFENGSIERLIKMQKPIAFVAGDVYYVEHNNNNKIDWLCYYNVVTGDTGRLYSAYSICEVPVIPDTEGSFYVQAFEEPEDYYAENYKLIWINNRRVLDTVTPVSTQQGSPFYYLLNTPFKYFYTLWVVKDNNAPTLLDDSLNGCIPISSGVILHEAGGSGVDGDLFQVRMIDEDGQLLDLIQIDAQNTKASITIYGSKLYYSVRRCKPFGSFGDGKPDYPKDDELSGTYLYSLTDGSMKKINDHSYLGMYVFDDSGIYVTDEHGSIYLMDFDGMVIDTLFNVDSLRFSCE